MIMIDKDILALNKSNVMQPVFPFVDNSCGSPSYGLSSHGYDVRLSNQFIYYNFEESVNEPLDPTRDNFKELVDKYTIKLERQKITLFPGSFVLAASFESFNLPEDWTFEVKDKSTWARLGIAVQNTTAEPEWAGKLTLEISNHNCVPIVLTAGVGIAQIVFHKLHARPRVTYADRNGKYQLQGLKEGDFSVTLPL